jgi:alpha-ribazole phosphatase
MELNFGEWEMQHWDDIPRGMVDVWAQDHLEQAPPQGESFQALHLRAKSFLQEICASCSSNVAIVFTCWRNTRAVG